MDSACKFDQIRLNLAKKSLALQRRIKAIVSPCRKIISEGDEGVPSILP
jgi:hypothetical protein